MAATIRNATTLVNSENYHLISNAKLQDVTGLLLDTLCQKH